jgi:hypothetical protein
MAFLLWLSLGLVGALPTRAAERSGPDFELVPRTVLAFDADIKDVTAATNATNAYFTFWVTNVCATNVLIVDVSSSCGCTVAQLPSLPWLLPPGESGPIKVTLDLRGHHGLVFKGVHITTSAGVKALVLRAKVPLAAPAVSNAVPVQPPPPRPAWERKPALPPRTG